MLGIRIVCPSGVTCARNQNSVSEWSYMWLGIRIVCPSGVTCVRNQKCATVELHVPQNKNSVSWWSYMCSESE